MCRVLKQSRQRLYLFTLALLGALAMSGGAAHAAAGSNMYYKIGGGSPVSVSAGRGHSPSQLGLGVRWDSGSSCGSLNPMATVENQLNGSSRGFHNMMSRVVQNAKGAVAALPAMIIQRAAPALYDLLNNGVLQGKLNYNKAKTSCRAMAKKAAGVITSKGWKHQAMSENWSKQARRHPDAVRARRTVETQGGDNGVTWVDGEKAGGSNQQPIKITKDTAIAGYDLLYGRNDPESTAPVPGGDQGWGSIPTEAGDWPGARRNNPDGSSGHGCQGGMCTVWGSPDEAAHWIKDVVGGETIRTCSGCNKIESQAGTGLMHVLQQQKTQIQQKLTAMVAGDTPVTQAKLQAVSAGPGMSVSDDVIHALANDPQGGMLTHRLASEMALSRTLTQALWARRVLLAGASEPGIANNQKAQKALDQKLAHLDRGIQGLKTEMQVRQSLANNAAQLALTRQAARANAGKRMNGQPGQRRIDSRKRIKQSTNGP
ncbi:hypothetical protein [Salinisphaera orenii]|uniref:hypothetical protein n=1 Tax=Salinisphaera orenii TaxID=856731 RepID=UPI000DBE45D5